MQKLFTNGDCPLRVSFSKICLLCEDLSAEYYKISLNL